MVSDDNKHDVVRETIQGTVTRVYEVEGYHPYAWMRDYKPPPMWKLTIDSDGRKLDGTKPKAMTHIKPGDKVEFTAEVHTYFNGRQCFKYPRDMRIVGCSG